MKNLMTPKMQAIERAVIAYEAIKEASSSPEKSISGENLEIYKELLDWDLIDEYSISNLAYRRLYIVIIAMHLSKDYAEYSSSDSFSKIEDKGKKWQMIQDALSKTVKMPKKKN